MDRSCTGYGCQRPGNCWYARKLRHAERRYRRAGKEQLRQQQDGKNGDRLDHGRTLHRNFVSGEETTLELSITDGYGKKVYVRRVNTSLKQVEIDMTPLARGIYYLDASKADGTVNENIRLMKGY